MKKLTPIQCPETIEAAKVELERIRSENTKLAETVDRVGIEVDEWERGEQDCDSTKSAVESFSDNVPSLAIRNADELEALDKCTSELQSDIVEWKRRFPANLQHVKRLKSVNNLIIELQGSKQSFVDAKFNSRNLKSKIDAAREACNWN